MKIVCAPDSFKGSIDAAAAAAAMASGIKAALPRIDVDCCPIGDGGEGTRVALLNALDGEVVRCRIHDLQHRTIDASIGGFQSQKFAYVESAEAIGLHLTSAEQRNVMTASSYGVGELLINACEQKLSRVLVGLGGSGSNDGGCGMAKALGVSFLDSTDRLIETPLTGETLQRIHRIDAALSNPAIADANITALCDVSNPLTGPEGASHIFAPQKGASASDVEILDAGLEQLADIVQRDLGLDVRTVQGAGAAGGLGAGMIAFAGASLASGITTVLDAIEFDARLAGASLCLTGEGRIDGQSLSGKACMGVAAAALKQAIPVIALVGSAGADASRCLEGGITEIIEIGAGHSLDESMANASTLLAKAAGAAAKKYC